MEKSTQITGGGAMKTHILIFPFPAQGHMLPLLDLTHHLSTLYPTTLSLTILTTPKNLPLISPLLTSSPSIQPLILPFPSYPSIPPNVENAKDLSAPSSLRLLIHAMGGLHTPLLSWFESNINPPTAIISDFFLGWTQQLAEQLSIPRITFSPSNALTISIGHCLWRCMPTHDDPDDPYFSVPFPSLPNSPAYPWCQLSPLYRSYTKEEPVSEFLKQNYLSNTRSWGFVFNTFSNLEATYLEHLKRDLGHERVWAVGPVSLIGGSAADRGGASSVSTNELLTWLDACESGSVLFVCFGSEAELTPTQAASLATGLESGGVHFVWGVKLGTVVPEGFEERVKGRGVVIRGWAPQVEILGHESVAWFLTHCGWNSALEGIVAGVAMLTWPMGADQFINARFLEEDVGVGVRVCEGREAVPDGEELGRVLSRTVGVDKELRKRAMDVRKKALDAVKDGGSSLKEVEDLIHALSAIEAD